LLESIAMDYIRTPSKSAFKSRKVLIVAVSAFLLIAIGGLLSLDFTTQRVDRSKLTISTVKRGALEIKVNANGQLVPRNVEYIASQVNGRVAKTFVKPGDAVKPGTLLVQLENPQLVASEEEARSAWEGALNEAKAARADLHAELLAQQSVLTQAKFAMERAQVRLDAESKLVGQGIISEIDYENSKLNLAQTKQQYALEQERFSAIRNNVNVQIDVRQSRANELAKAYERARDQVANLKIVSTIDGVVQELSVDVGQQMQPGAPIGRVAQPGALYAELRVPAREATEVQAGQKVIVDTRNGTIDGVVSRIDPAVRDGVVIVDVDLPGKMPQGARPQLQVEGIIYIAQLSDALYVGRPAYVKSNASLPVYLLDRGENYAERTVFASGKVSLDHVQVLSGLKEGDRIITSETGEWQGKERILLSE
jgi:multidrug efflux pump subunit AcrA (membrane-fusion protein)